MKTKHCNETTAADTFGQATPADTRPGAAMRIPSVTQNRPENGYRIVPSAPGDSPTQQELGQDVTATNPSIESMESRG